MHVEWTKSGLISAINILEIRVTETPLPILKRETMEGRAYVVLRREILEGRLKPGQRLVQDELAADLGISRIPVRGALKLLETAGLVVADAKGSYSVAPFGADDIEEIYGLRLVLEPYAARLALPRIASDVVKRLQDLNAEMKAAAADEDTDRWTELNAEFHLAIYDAAGQPRLMRIIRDLWFGRPSFSPIKSRAQLERSTEEHEALIAAIIARDVHEFERRVHDHIRRAGDRWATLLARR